MNELNMALQNVYAHMKVLQDVIDEMPEETVPTEHYISLRDDVADLIIATISNNESEKLRLTTLILKTYFTKSEREKIVDAVYLSTTQGDATNG